MAVIKNHQDLYPHRAPIQSGNKLSGGMLETLMESFGEANSPVLRLGYRVQQKHQGFSFLRAL